MPPTSESGDAIGKRLHTVSAHRTPHGCRRTSCLLRRPATRYLKSHDARRVRDGLARRAGTRLRERGTFWLLTTLFIAFVKSSAESWRLLFRWFRDFAWANLATIALAEKLEDLSFAADPLLLRSSVDRQLHRWDSRNASGDGVLLHRRA